MSGIASARRPIDGREGFIEQQDFRASRERTGKCDPLLLTAL